MATHAQSNLCRLYMSGFRIPPSVCHRDPTWHKLDLISGFEVRDIKCQPLGVLGAFESRNGKREGQPVKSFQCGSELRKELLSS
ncbi:hypothetical protein ACS0TY_032525 [Phlomoides rotata]